MSEHRVTNPTGRGGFGDRPQDQWRAKLARGEVTSRCTATSKRSGERCRFPATKGYGVCYWHGARGGYGKFRAPTSKRNLANKEIQRARLWAEAEVAQRVARNEIRPEVYGALKDIIGKIHPADEARALLALDLWFDGALTSEAWEEARRALGLLPPWRPPAPTPALSSTPELQPSMVELWPTRSSKS
jgi:hypothetical protein